MTSSSLHFPGQHPNERVVAIVHRHWFDLASHLVLVAALSLFLLGGLILLPLLFPEVAAGQNYRFILFLENSFLLTLWLFGFLVWIDTYFDVWIITDQRLINVEQRGLFAREVSEVRHERVQDAAVFIGGLVPTMLNFGDLAIQSAGTETRFLFRRVPDPLALKDVIMRLAKEHSPKEVLSRS